MKNAATRRTGRDLDIPEVDITRARVVRRGPAGKRVSLRAMREGVHKTQAQVAKALGMTQSEVSRLESRDDVLLSTLRAYARALGAECEVVMVFPKTGHRLRVAVGD